MLHIGQHKTSVLMNISQWKVTEQCSLWHATLVVCIYSSHYKLKVKCTLVQALRLCTGRTAHRGSRGIALPFHDLSTRRGWGVSIMPRPLFTPRKDTVPIVQEAGWAPGLVWTGVENLAPTRIRSPDRPACSQSLYWLCYAAHQVIITVIHIKVFIQLQLSGLCYSAEVNC
jgi:hypothetical protein